MERNELIKTVEKAKQGNREAFEKLYSSYYQKVYCFVLKNVGKKEAAEDITQDTFLKSMEKIGGLEKPESYSTWLHSIAYNSCMDMFRSQKRNTYFETDAEMESAIDNTDLNEPIMVPEDYMINKDRAEQLRAMIDSLKPDVRSAMIMYYYDDMNVSQVANALGMKENLAKQKLFRGRKKLRDKIEQLQQQGILLCAMPVGELMKNTYTAKQAAACKAAFTANAHSTMLMGKIVGVSTAAVLAVSVPFILHKAHNTGIVTDDSSAVHRNDIPNVNNDSSNSEDSSTANDESKSEEVISAAPAAAEIEMYSEAEASSAASDDSSSQAEKIADDWKTAYKDYISEGKYRDLTNGFSDGSTGEKQMITDDTASFNLAYIDEDDVPELLVTGGQSVHILTYKDGKINHIKTDDENGNIGWYGQIEIVEKQGLFLDDYQHMGTYTTPVYKLGGTEATLMSNIEYYWNSSENTEKYIVGSDEVSESTYLDELKKYKLNTYYTEKHPKNYIKDDNWTVIESVYGIGNVNDFIDSFNAENRSGYRYSKDIYAEYADMIDNDSKTDSSTSESNADSSTTEKKTDAWRTAYKEYISNGEYRSLTTGLSDGSTGERYMVSDENAKFALAYLDDDDIPELFVSGGMSVHVLSYKNGKIEQLITDDSFGNINWYGNVKIVEKQGLFLDDYQRMGIYSTPVYKYSGGSVELLSDIEYTQMPDGESLTDLFKINGTEVSESDYLAELAKYNLNTYYTEVTHGDKAIASDNWTTINTYDGQGISDISTYIDNF